MKALWVAVVGMAGIAATAAVLGGCGNSIYHQARASQPSYLPHRVKQRVEEGRRIAEAARTDIGHLATAKDERDRSIRMELLVVQGHDLTRAAFTIEDVATRLDESDVKGASLEAARAMKRAATAVTAAGGGAEDGRTSRLAAASEALGSALEAAGRVAEH